MKKIFFGLLCGLSTVLLTASFNASARESIFMEISDIEGSSTVDNYEGWHPLLSMGFGVERTVDMTDLGSTQRGHANSNFQKIEITRYYDASSPLFFLSVAKGTIRPEITFHYTTLLNAQEQEKEAGPQTYMTMTLKHVVIDSITHTVSDDGIPEENISLAYIAIEYNSKSVDPKTGKLTTANTFTWNIQTGKPE